MLNTTIIDIRIMLASSAINKLRWGHYRGFLVNLSNDRKQICNLEKEKKTIYLMPFDLESFFFFLTFTIKAFNNAKNRNK